MRRFLGESSPHLRLTCAKKKKCAGQPLVELCVGIVLVFWRAVPPSTLPPVLHNPIFFVVRVVVSRHHGCLQHFTMKLFNSCRRRRHPFSLSLAIPRARSLALSLSIGYGLLLRRASRHRPLARSLSLPLSLPLSFSQAQ